MEIQKTGRLIAQARREKSLTQQALAERLGVTNQAVSKWEQGHSFPDPSLVEPLGAALGLSLEELFAGERRTEIPMEEAGQRGPWWRVSKKRWRLRGEMCSIFLGGIFVLALMATVLKEQMVDEQGNLILNWINVLYDLIALFPLALAWYGCGRRQKLEPFPRSNEGFWRTWIHRELPRSIIAVVLLFSLSSLERYISYLMFAYTAFASSPTKAQLLLGNFVFLLFGGGVVQICYSASYLLYTFRRCHFRCLKA